MEATTSMLTDENGGTRNIATVVKSISTSRFVTTSHSEDAFEILAAWCVPNLCSLCISQNADVTLRGMMRMPTLHTCCAR